MADSEERRSAVPVTNEGRFEAVTGVLGSVFVPIGFVGLIGNDANPHSSLWNILGIVGFAVGTPSILSSLAARWRRRGFRRRPAERTQPPN